MLDRTLVLLAEHELATSTLAVRVAASTRSGPAEAVLAGLGALSGPLHGRAPTTVHARLLAVAARRAVAATETGPHAEGIGHVVHRRGDPRFALLMPSVLTMAPTGMRAVIRADLDAHVGAAPPNLDSALGALVFVARARPGAAEAVFALARCAGWLAHAHEEADERPLRFRGRTIHRSPR